jgi:ABC-type dipeptide/oligopeptide/nickel transport system permease subunit
MSTSVTAPGSTTVGAGQSLTRRAWHYLVNDAVGLSSLAVVLSFLLLAAGVWGGLWGQDWSKLSNLIRGPVSSLHWFGTNAIGQDIFERVLASTRTAFEIGLPVAFLSTLIGAALGAISGYFSGSWLDETVLWCKGVLDAIPFYLLVAAIAFAMQGNPWAMHLAMVSTFWTSTARLVRGEVMSLKQQEFVAAALALGTSTESIIFRHILPNTFHILLVQVTIVFVAAIKSEVILSFLGLGVQDGVSWGLMIAESTQDVLAGHLNNFLAASGFMFVLVMSFNLLSNALQDAFDPKAC